MGERAGGLRHIWGLLLGPLANGPLGATWLSCPAGVRQAWSVGSRWVAFGLIPRYSALSFGVGGVGWCSSHQGSLWLTPTSSFGADAQTKM